MTFYLLTPVLLIRAGQDMIFFSYGKNMKKGQMFHFFINLSLKKLGVGIKIPKASLKNLQWKIQMFWGFSLVEHQKSFSFQNFALCQVHSKFFDKRKTFSCPWKIFFNPKNSLKLKKIKSNLLIIFFLLLTNIYNHVLSGLCEIQRNVGPSPRSLQSGLEAKTNVLILTQMMQMV